MINAGDYNKELLKLTIILLGGLPYRGIYIIALCELHRTVDVRGNLFPLDLDVSRQIQICY